MGAMLARMSHAEEGGAAGIETIRTQARPCSMAPFTGARYTATSAVIGKDSQSVRQSSTKMPVAECTGSVQALKNERPNAHPIGSGARLWRFSASHSNLRVVVASLAQAHGLVAQQPRWPTQVEACTGGSRARLTKPWREGCQMGMDGGVGPRPRVSCWYSDGHRRNQRRAYESHETLLTRDGTVYPCARLNSVKQLWSTMRCGTSCCTSISSKCRKSVSGSGVPARQMRRRPRLKSSGRWQMRRRPRLKSSGRRLSSWSPAPTPNRSFESKDELNTILSSWN